MTHGILLKYRRNLGRLLPHLRNMATLLFITARIRRMGKVMFSVCPHLWEGGYPYPIMLCNITQNAMGQTPGGYPYPIMLCNITQNAMGQTPRGYPARSSWGGGGRGGGGTLLVGYLLLGGTQLGQQKEYSLHGGRYGSCIHAGGLSCYHMHLKDGRR